VSCRDQAFFASLCLEEIDIMMNGSVNDESNAYKCYNSNDATNEGNLKKTSFNSMNEGRNEETNGEH
jgi:hypothetical protein